MFDEILNILKRDPTEWNIWREKNPDAYISLANVNLSRINLAGANFQELDLSGVDFRGSNLVGVNFTRTKLSFANFEDSIVGKCIFSDVDLSHAIGLEKIIHKTKSSIGLDTLAKSEGKISKTFLLGIGVPDSVIAYLPSLFGIGGVDFFSCFISYSTEDAEFAKLLGEDLRAAGIRVWLDQDIGPTGQEIWKSIDKVISRSEILIVVLSENSIKSKWIQKEVERFLSAETLSNETKIFPIIIDDSFRRIDGKNNPLFSMLSNRLILDFEGWNEKQKYKGTASRLIREITSSVASERVSNED